jgi:hypothetical protein
MSIEIAKYQFHSWARKGISGNILEPDDLGAGTGAQLERAQVAVGVALNGTGQAKNFLLIGPGDIIGVNSNMIVRTEPLNWVTNFEPNYLAFLEFYDEDFTWRYTPAAPAGSKLRPWLLLLVLKADEFERTNRQVPLASINLKSKDVFPPLTETYLWAHMHSNANIPDSELTDYEKWLLSLNQTMNADPDQLYSRLICPRKLEANTGYNVFLVPSFETGRLAGLEQDTSTTHAQTPSWDYNGAKGEMPVYFEWYFRTGLDEDFESLVNQLQPRPMDPKVGIRDMDCSRPGFVRADNPSLELDPTSPKIIGLEGALKAPTTTSTVFPDPPAANSFQVQLQAIANLPYTIVGQPDSKDPIISIPIYGSNHAKLSANDEVQLDITQGNWVNDLNKDPRTRVSGGFGTTVIQGNQAYFLRKAWAQVGGIVAANQLIKSSVFMMKVALQYTLSTVSKFTGPVLLAVSKPVLSRILGSPTTLYQQLQVSKTPTAVFSGAFRRLVRPQGKFIKKLSPSGNFDYSGMVTALTNGDLDAGPVAITPAGLPNTQDIAGQITGTPLPAWLQWLITNRVWVLIALLLLALVLAFIAGIVAALIVATAAVGAYVYLNNRQNIQQQDATAAHNLADPQAELDSLPSIPQQPAFSLKLAAEATAPSPTPAAAGQDSVEAAHFRTALTDADKRFALQPPVVAKTIFAMDNGFAKLSAALHPHVSFPLRLAARIKFPGYIPIAQPDKIFPAMAYPDIDDPMYKYLCAISQELLMPNIKLIPPDTISLVQTNPKFIESYMVGLNHEMGRELLWNEYPTDERGSYFRQFWDVKGIIEPSTTLTPAQLTESYKDIKPIDTWTRPSLLGGHLKGSPPGTVTPQAVLVIRGELLKRYPNTLIFAQKAIPGSSEDGADIDLNLTDTTFPKEVKFPLYRADASPDIKFFGFALTIGQAKGTELTPGFTDNLGWFFVIQEVPGEPRFGMDVTYGNPAQAHWEDLAWTNFADPNMGFISAAKHPALNVADDNSRWGKDSASMAYILFRKPAMVAVHASEMLASLDD